MASRKLTGIIGAVLALFVGLYLDNSVMKPLADTIMTTFPCQPNAQFIQTCMNTKTMLFFAPHIGAFTGIYGVLRKIGL